MWSKAKFTNKVKEEIYERDWWCCILCWSNQWLTAHHAFFSDQAIRDNTRNNAEMWVTICPTCHSWKDKDWKQGCHWCSVWEWKRQEAINYLTNLYDTTYWRQRSRSFSETVKT